MPTTERTKVTIPSLQARKSSGPPIVRVNCYDYLTAKILDQVGVEMILVGESVGRHVLGYPSVDMVTFDEILHHARAVRRGAKYALVVADLPLEAATLPVTEVVRMGQRLLDDGLDAAKIEGGQEVMPQIEALVSAGIPVHGTLRYDPAGADPVSQARELYRIAIAQEKAGCFMLSLSRFPADLARYLTQQLTIPTIGIGSGQHCDGQVVLINDILGYVDGPPRSYVKAYANLYQQTEAAVRQFKSEVESGIYPEPVHWYEMGPAQFDAFYKKSRE